MARRAAVPIIASRDKEERQEKNEENMSRQILKNVITETKINSNFILKRKTFEIFYLFCSFVF
jgi:pullulanase/glycogen debranching enzyme